MLVATRLQDHLAGAPLRIPEADRLAFGWFVDLSRARTYHAAGPHPISYAEIEAYARLMRWPLEPRHVEMIRALDDAWMKAQTKKAEPPVMTVATFDGVLG